MKLVANQPVEGVELQNAFMGNRLGVIQRQKILRIIVAGGAQRRKFPLERRRLHHRLGDLVISPSLFTGADEIDFLVPHFADGNIGISPRELEVDDVFQDSLHIPHLAGKQHPAHAHIHAVILFRKLQETLSPHIETLHRIKEIAVAKPGKIFGHRIGRHLHPLSHQGIDDA